MSLSSFFGKVGVGPAASILGIYPGVPQMGKTYYAGRDLTDSGTALQDQAIGGMNSDIVGNQDLIAKGGLTPALNKQFDMARASVLDRSTAQKMGVRTSLAQRNLEAGGTLSPQAIAEMQTGANENIGQNEFAANNDVNMAQAQMSQQAIQAAMDRISQARNSILGAGTSRMVTGSGMRISALDAMTNRRNQSDAQTAATQRQIISTAGSMFGGGMGGL